MLTQRINTLVLSIVALTFTACGPMQTDDEAIHQAMQSAAAGKSDGESMICQLFGLPADCAENTSLPEGEQLCPYLADHQPAWYPVALLNNVCHPMGLTNREALDIVLVGGARITIELLPNAPRQHVERVKKLADAGFYDGRQFTRTSDGFITGFCGACDYGPLTGELSQVPLVRGMVGMAKVGSDARPSPSAFMIFTKDATSAASSYTAWGRVITGMHVVDSIVTGSGTYPSSQSPHTIDRVIVDDDD